MNERLPKPGPREENFIAFPHHSHFDEHREQGLTPTNNLYLFFLEADSDPVGEDGMPKPYHPDNREFGPIMREFRRANSEVWTAAQKSAAAYHDAEQRHIAKVFAGERGPDPELEAAYWTQAEFMHETFSALVPEFEAAEIDPLDMCR